LKYFEQGRVAEGRRSFSVLRQWLDVVRAVDVGHDLVQQIHADNALRRVALKCEVQLDSSAAECPPLKPLSEWP